MDERNKMSFIKRIWSNECIPYIAISVFAVVFFVLIYGVKVLDFQNVDWLYGHYEVKKDCFYGKDLTQHYLGWLCYRQSDWTFPIGNMDLFSYPYQTSVIYTDSIPLFALFFKILSPILPAQFQYFGLWAILCFVLQGIMAVRLFRTYTSNPIKLVLSAAFFVIVPMLLWRTFIHSALCAHWIILMAMEPLVSKEIWNRKKLIIHYSLVGFLASMTAIYLLLFCGIVLIGTCVRDVLETKKAYNSVLSLASFVGVAAVAIALMGGFSGEFESSLGGLGLYSMNLNSLFDSYGFSSFIPELPRYVTEIGDKQFEGYGYLGVGFGAMVVIAVLILIYGFRNYIIIIKKRKEIITGMLLSGVIALVYAVSSVVTLNNWKIIEIPLPSIIRSLWSIFRATGRGVWIVVYLLMFLVCCFINKISKKILAEVVLSLCLIVQMVDNFPMYKTIRSYYTNEIETFYNYESLTGSSEFWDEIAANKNIKNIILANTTSPYDDENVMRINNVYDSFVGPDDGVFKMYQYLLGDFSIKNGKTFNYFRFSRHPYERSRQYVLNKLKNPTDEDLFVFYDYNKFQGIVAGLNMYCVDGLYIGYVDELEEKYKLRAEECAKTYIFGTSLELESDDNYYSLNSGDELKCFTLEMPVGVYVVNIYADESEQLDYALSIASNEYAQILYYECNDDVAQYIVLIESDTYRAYNYFRNSGEKTVDLYAIEIKYIGQVEDLYD